jgi:hypothetical protein
MRPYFRGEKLCRGRSDVSSAWLAPTTRGYHSEEVQPGSSRGYSTASSPSALRAKIGRLTRERAFGVASAQRLERRP